MCIAALKAESWSSTVTEVQASLELLEPSLDDRDGALQSMNNDILTLSLLSLVILLCLRVINYQGRGGYPARQRFPPSPLPS